MVATRYGKEAEEEHQKQKQPTENSQKPYIAHRTRTAFRPLSIAGSAEGRARVGITPVSCMQALKPNSIL